MTKHLLHCLHVVGAAALQDPALPSSKGLQLKVLLDLPEEARNTKKGEEEVNPVY